MPKEFNYIASDLQIYKTFNNNYRIMNAKFKNTGNKTIDGCLSVTISQGNKTMSSRDVILPAEGIPAGEEFVLQTFFATSSSDLSKPYTFKFSPKSLWYLM